MCNKQSKAKTNRQKHKKLTELVGTSKQKTQRHGCRVSWAVTPASARDSVIQINAGLAAQPENKSAETRRKMKRGGSQNMQQMRGCRNLRGSLIFGTRVWYSFGRRWTRFRPRPGLLPPLWPEMEREKGHKELSPGMFSSQELITGTLKTEQFWENWQSLFELLRISWCLGSTYSHSTTLLCIYHQIIASELTNPCRADCVSRRNCYCFIPDVFQWSAEYSRNQPAV